MEYIKQISTRAEFAIVVSIAFGYLMLASTVSAFHPATVPESEPAINEAGLRFLLLYESVILLVLGLFLSARGWQWRRFGLAPSIEETLQGVCLTIGAYVACAVTGAAAALFISGLEDQAAQLVGSVDALTVVAISLLNPIFEELFVCGYIITVLKEKRGTLFAVNASVGIRLIYHLYQGVSGVVAIIPLGLIFAYWFAGTGRLWPIVVSHAIFDFAGLWAYVR